MKALLTLSVTTLLFAANARAESKCVIVANDNIPFESTHEKVEEYLATEKTAYGGFIFKFMEGHGQHRLVAYKNGKLHAATFSGRATELNLEANSVQAGCSFEE